MHNVEMLMRPVRVGASCGVYPRNCTYIVNMCYVRRAYGWGVHRKDVQYRVYANTTRGLIYLYREIERMEREGERENERETDRKADRKRGGERERPGEYRGRQ